jgi:hypothetical protein
VNEVPALLPSNTDAAPISARMSARCRHDDLVRSPGRLLGPLTWSAHLVNLRPDLCCWSRCPSGLQPTAAMAHRRTRPKKNINGDAASRNRNACRA